MRLRSVITGVVLLVLATSGVAAGHEPEAVFPTRTVVVAADFIPAGEPIEAAMLTLREVAIRKMARGEVPFEEVIGVIGLG